MTIEEQKQINSDVDSTTFVDSWPIGVTTNKKPKWLLWLGAIALVVGITIVWCSISAPKQSNPEIADKLIHI